MPDIIVSLDDFKKTVDNFNKILSMTIVHPKIGGEISFQGVESGSNWYKVFVKTATAVSLLGGLMWSAAVVFKKYQEGKIMEQYVVDLELQNKYKADLINAHKVLSDLTIEFEAKALYKKFYEEGEIDNEQIERLKTALKILADEISKGAEINPALTAPEKVTNLFPNMKLLPMIEPRINKIENKN